MSGGDWIALDAAGGRAWAMDGPRVRQVLSGDLSLTALQSDWPGLPILASGLTDAPVTGLPAKPLNLRPIPIGDQVFATLGLSQDTPPDRICGPEALIAGFLAHNRGWDGVLCLIGPISRWVLISAEEVVSVQPFLTGQMLEALRALPDLADLPTGTPDDFETALNDAMSRPERMAAWLAALQAAGTQVRLQGLLIGAELAAARHYWLGQQVAVIGAAPAAYVTALKTQGVPVTRTDEVAMMLAGLNAFRRQIG